MAEMGNIRPVTPIVPKRPADRVKPGRRRPDPDNRQRRPPHPDDPHRDHDDDQRPHIDEYA